MTTKPITWIGDINTTTPKGMLQKSVNNSPFQIVDNNTSSGIEHIQLTEFIFQFFFRLEDWISDDGFKTVFWRFIHNYLTYNNVKE